MSYFIWKGTDSRTKGIILKGPAQIIRGEERVNHVTIPGMAGELTMLEGEDIYQSYIQTVTIHVKSLSDVKAAYQWLRGSGYVTFSGESDKRQQARIIGAISLDKHSKNFDIWSGEVQFYCDPFKELLSPSNVTLTSAGTVTNNGDVKCYPVITAKSSGTSMSIITGTSIFTLTGITSNTNYTIDSRAGIVLQGTTNVTAKSSGAFPVLAVGSNTITGSGWSKLVYDRRERYL